MSSTKNIDNLIDLQAAIIITKQRVRESEADIQDRWKRLPQETIKATVGSIVPMFLNNAMASGSWGVLKGLANFFKRKKENEKGWKEEVITPAKKIGVSAILKMLYGVIKK